MRYRYAVGFIVLNICLTWWVLINLVGICLNNNMRNGNHLHPHYRQKRRWTSVLYCLLQNQICNANWTPRHDFFRRLSLLISTSSSVMITLDNALKATIDVQSTICIFVWCSLMVHVSIGYLYCGDYFGGQTRPFCINPYHRYTIDVFFFCSTQQHSPPSFSAEIGVADMTPNLH